MMRILRRSSKQTSYYENTRVRRFSRLSHAKLGERKGEKERAGIFPFSGPQPSEHHACSIVMVRRSPLPVVAIKTSS